MGLRSTSTSTLAGLLKRGGAAADAREIDEGLAAALAASAVGAPVVHCGILVRCLHLYACEFSVCTHIYIYVAS